MRRKTNKGNVPDDSEEESDVGSDTPDSDDTVDMSVTANKNKPGPKRKRGRPPATAKNKRQRIQSDSDDAGSPQPSTSQNVNGQSSIQDSESENDSGDDSDYVVASTSNTNNAPRLRGQQSVANKKQDASQNADNQDSENEGDSGSESADSDFGPVGERSRVKKKKPQKHPAVGKRQLPSRTATVKKNLSNSVNGQESSTQEKPQKHTAVEKRQLPSRTATVKKNLSNSVNGQESSTQEKPQKHTAVEKRQLPSRTASVKKNLSNSVNGQESSTQEKPQKHTAVEKRQLPSRTATVKKNLSNSVNGVSKPSQANDSTFDPKLVENLAQKLVYFLLIDDQKKYAIRRKAIVTHVFKDDVYTPKLYSAVIKKANIILKKIYGMELMELENQKDSYLIVNILRRELGAHDYVELPRIKQQQHGLILYLLTVIFMNENVITEDELTKCLKPLDIDLTSKRMHAVFGDVKKYITVELVKQMYLNYVCITKDPPRYEFTWGLRAKQEFDKRDLLQFVCQIIDDTSPEDWRMQFGDAEESAKPDARS